VYVAFMYLVFSVIGSVWLDKSCPHWFLQ